MKYPEHLKPDVPDDELQQDISDIAQGVQAHRMVRDGYAILAGVDDPENRPTCRFRSAHADAKVAQLAALLVRTRQLAEDRKAFRDAQQESTEPVSGVPA